MDTSIFIDLSKTPAAGELMEALSKTYPLWQKIRDFVFANYPAAVEEWHVAIKKHGWSFRIKDKKRAIIYFLPRKDYFKVAMVFGQKATDLILNSDISETIKMELINAKVYMEGRGIRIDIYDDTLLNDIKKLVEIKIAN